MTGEWIEEVKFDADGLVPAIVQDGSTGRILMFAWMNRESLERTVVGGGVLVALPRAPLAQG